MSALAACLVEMEESLEKKEGSRSERISLIARLASGSACRSNIANYAVWGKSKLDFGTDEFAIEFTDYHENFTKMCDSVVIVNAEEKSVSSSAGHALMNSHLYREIREYQAHENFRSIVGAMKNGDYESFGETLENEALSLHALMMTSYPSFLLLRPNSLAIIEKVREFRRETKKPLYFTIDAGPNIHLIYPDSIKETVASFISDELAGLYDQVIHDSIGQGLIRSDA